MHKRCPSNIIRILFTIFSDKQFLFTNYACDKGGLTSTVSFVPERSTPAG